jgi:hypothetical protein
MKICLFRAVDAYRVGKEFYVDVRYFNDILETIGDRNYLAGVNVLRILLNTIRMV